MQKVNIVGVTQSGIAARNVSNGTFCLLRGHLYLRVWQGYTPDIWLVDLYTKTTICVDPDAIVHVPDKVDIQINM